MPQSPFPILPAAEVQVRADATIIEGIAVINRSDARIALVIDDKGRMVGSLVDGDVRRALLAGCTLQSPVAEAMHSNPYVMPASSSRQQIIDSMQAATIKQMPLLKPDGTLVGIASYDMLTGFARVPRSNPVVIMAGGKGKRLMPLTENLPKPMVKVGGKPMLEHIVQQFVRQGFSHFHIAINYLGHIIEEYFGNGEKWNCDISYIREREFLGTAGALSLIDAPFTEPFIVINVDIMTAVDFNHLLDYHLASDSMATVGARAHRVEVPFGVIQIKDGMMQAIVEKPVYEDLVSAGIYVLNPKALSYVPPQQAIDMPELLQILVKDAHKVAIFPLHEEWTDVGRYDDLEQAKRNFASN